MWLSSDVSIQDPACDEEATLDLEHVDLRNIYGQEFSVGALRENVVVLNIIASFLLLSAEEAETSCIPYFFCF